MITLRPVRRNLPLALIAVASITFAPTTASAAIQAVTSHDNVNLFNPEIQGVDPVADGELLDGLTGVQVETVPAGNPNQVVGDWNDSDALSRLQGDLNPSTADFDESGFVDGDDFLTWQRGFGKMGVVTRADGDATGNGEVDGIDLQQWELQYGTDGDIFGNGTPTVTVAFDLGGEFDISEIKTYSNWGDARTFQTFVVNFSTDNGSNFTPLGYFESDPGGVIPFINSPLAATRVVISDDAAGLLGTGVTNIRFDIYAGSIITGTEPFLVNLEAADPYDGINPFTGLDDSQPAATVGTAWQEIDVFGTPTPQSPSASTGVPEPSTFAGFLFCSMLFLNGSFRHARK